MFDPKEVDRILGVEREPEGQTFESKVDSILGVQRKQDGPLARGFKQLSSSIDYSKSMTTGDTAGAARSIAESAKYRQRNPGTKEGRELSEAWEGGDGIWGGIKAVAGEMKKDISESKNWRQAAYETGKNVKAMAGGVVEQMPNMILPMAGMVGGGLAGSSAGPVGTAGGAFVGASTGNAIVEGQHIAIRALQNAGIDLNDEEMVSRYLQENAGDLFRQAAVKGSVIGAVDTVTAGLGAKLLTAPARAASRRALTNMGVDVTDRAAVKIASESAEFKRMLANDAVYQASKQGIRNAARNAGVAVMDPTGEFAGEYLGSGVALGEWDEKEAMLEALSSIGQSGAMFAGQKGYERIARPNESLPRVENPDAREVPYSYNDPIEKAFAKVKDTKPSDKDALSAISNPKYTNTVTPEHRPIYDDLVKRGLARNNGGTYSITDEGRKILGQERKPVDTKGMTGKEKQTIKALETKGKPSRLSDLKMDEEQKAAISSLMKKGIIRRNDNGTFELISEDIAPESAERDLMYQFADTAQDVQDQADARTRAYRFEQMPGEIAWREQEQAAREYNQRRNEPDAPTSANRYGDGQQAESDKVPPVSADPTSTYLQAQAIEREANSLAKELNSVEVGDENWIGRVNDLEQKAVALADIPNTEMFSGAKSQAIEAVNRLKNHANTTAANRAEYLRGKVYEDYEDTAYRYQDGDEKKYRQIISDIDSGKIKTRYQVRDEEQAAKRKEAEKRYELGYDRELYGEPQEGKKYYYVTARNQEGKTAIVRGPFKEHIDALRSVEESKKQAGERYQFRDTAWGTIGTDEDLGKGVLDDAAGGADAMGLGLPGQAYSTSGTPEIAESGKQKPPATGQDTGQATGQVENTTEGATNEQVQGQAEEVAAPVTTEGGRAPKGAVGEPEITGTPADQPGVGTVKESSTEESPVEAPIKADGEEIVSVTEPKKDETAVQENKRLAKLDDSKADIVSVPDVDQFMQHGIRREVGYYKPSDKRGKPSGRNITPSMAVDKARAFLNKFTRQVPEFKKAPVFTVAKTDNGHTLRFTDSYTFDINPALFAIDPESIKPGQKVRIDLDAWSGKSTPEGKGKYVSANAYDKDDIRVNEGGGVWSSAGHFAVSGPTPINAVRPFTQDLTGAITKALDILSKGKVSDADSYPAVISDDARLVEINGKYFSVKQLDFIVKNTAANQKTTFITSDGIVGVQKDGNVVAIAAEWLDIQGTPDGRWKPVTRNKAPLIITPLKDAVGATPKADGAIEAKGQSQRSESAPFKVGRQTYRYTGEDSNQQGQKIGQYEFLHKGEWKPVKNIQQRIKADEIRNDDVMEALDSVKPWPKDFPRSFSHTTVEKVQNHKDFDAAKGGDIDAALRLVRYLAKPERLDQLARRFPDAVVVPVMEQERTGVNAIPYALAIELQSRGLRIADEIYQTSIVKRKGLSAVGRLISRKTFDGKVAPNTQYIIADDILTQGGTFGELRHFIANAGVNSDAVAVTSLAFSAGSNIIAIREGTANRIIERFGREQIEQLLRQYSTAGTIEALTDSEARAILKFQTIESLRARYAQEEGSLLSSESAGSQPAGQVRLETTTLGNLLDIAKRDKGVTGNLATLLSDFIPGSKLDTPALINPEASAPSYNPRTNTVTVRDAEQYHTSLHEIVHAVTVNALRSDTQQARAVRQQLKALMRRVRAEVKKMGIISQELLDQVEAAKTSQNFKQMYPDHATNQIAYAFLNEYEFLAQSFSDKQFQSILKDIRMPAGSKFVRAWDAFIDTVMRVLGIKATHKDAFGEAVSIVAELAQMDATGKASGVMEAAAWHGSPHRFDKFDISKIGTGEGAQAYGHGLYFSGKKEIAEFYKNKLTADMEAHKSRSRADINNAKKANEKYRKIIETGEGRGIFRDGRAVPDEWYKKQIRENEEFIEEAQAWIDKRRGGLYSVELTPKDDEYLLWDKPLSEQSEKVKDAILSNLSNDPDHPLWKEWVASIKGRGTAADFYKEMAGSFDDSPGSPSGSKAKAASEYLHYLGIRGIKYLDGSSRGKGEGDYNYVIFDDADVEITDIMEAIEDTPESSRPPKESRAGAIKETIGEWFDGSYFKKKFADIKFIEKIFSSPDWTFRKSPALWRLLNAQYDRMDAKFAIEKEILGNFIQVMQEGAKKFKADYQKAKKYLLDTDRTGKAFTIKRFAGFRVYSPDGKFIGNAETDVAANELRESAWTAHKAKNPDTKRLKADYRKEEGEWWDITDPDGKFVETFTDEAEAVKAVMARERDYLKKKGYSEKAQGMVLAYRQMTNNAFDRMVADLRKVLKDTKEAGLDEPTVSVVDETKRWGLYEGKKLIASFKTKEDAKQAGGKKHTLKMHTDAEIRKELSLNDAIAQIADLRGSYFARQRPRGAVIVRAEKGSDKVLLKTDMLMVADKYIDFQTGAEIKRPSDEKGKAFFNWLIGNVPGTTAAQIRKLRAQGYEITVERDTAMPESVFDVAKLSSSIAAILDDAQKKAKTGNKAAVAEISKIITANVADVFKSRGYLSSRLKRQEDYWRGFEEDPLLSGTQYAKGLAAGIAKKEAASRMLNIITGRDVPYSEWKEENPDGTFDEYQEFVDKRRIDPREQPGLYGEGMSFIKDMLRNEERVDRVLGTLQGLAVIKFLGFRISSAAVNAINMVQAVPATISSQAGISLTRSFNAISNAAVQYGKLKSKQPINAEDRAIFKEIIDRGWDQAQYNKEAAEVLMSRFGRAFDTFSEWSMKMFGAVEKANRSMTIFAAYKELKRLRNIDRGTPNNTLLEEDLLIRARDISNDAHGVYGKATRPSWARGAWNPLRLPFTFMKFSQNYVMNMADMGLKGDHKQAAYMLLSPAIVAGGAASLATPALAALASVLGIGGDDPEEEFYQWVEDNFGSDRFARHGIAGLAGVNFKGSLQINNPMPTRMSELFGAPQALFMDIKKGIEHYGKGELLKGTEAMLPTAFGSAFKAVREAREGISTGNYSPVYYGDEPIKADGLEATLRFLSFNPARISGIREKQWRERVVEQDYTKRRTEIYSKLKRYYIYDSGDIDKVMKEVYRYNEMVIASGRPGIPFITPDSIRNNIRRAMVPSKKERQRQ